MIRSGDVTALGRRLKQHGRSQKWHRGRKRFLVEFADPYAHVSPHTRKILTANSYFSVFGTCTSDLSNLGCPLRQGVMVEAGQPKQLLLRAGRELLTNLVNLKLKTAVTASLRPDEPNTQAEFRLRPNSLIEYIWLQFARDVDGGTAPRWCVRPGCPEWFTISKDCRRGHGKYCSDKCRVAGDRKRKRATRLAEQGMPPRAISREIDWPERQVRDWASLIGAKLNWSDEEIRDWLGL